MNIDNKAVVREIIAHKTGELKAWKKLFENLFGAKDTQDSKVSQHKSGSLQEPQNEHISK